MAVGIEEINIDLECGLRAPDDQVLSHIHHASSLVVKDILTALKVVGIIGGHAHLSNNELHAGHAGSHGTAKEGGDGAAAHHGESVLGQHRCIGCVELGKGSGVAAGECGGPQLVCSHNAIVHGIGRPRGGSACWHIKSDVDCALLREQRPWTSRVRVRARVGVDALESNIHVAVKEDQYVHHARAGLLCFASRSGGHVSSHKDLTVALAVVVQILHINRSECHDTRKVDGLLEKRSDILNALNGGSALQKKGSIVREVAGDGAIVAGVPNLLHSIVKALHLGTQNRIIRKHKLERRKNRQEQNPASHLF
eukprot:m.228965 g.228965  ORF g.228965 m.228965 type:complete len:310 (+) comp17633_c0_seq1:143-1072(+)